MHSIRRERIKHIYTLIEQEVVTFSNFLYYFYISSMHYNGIHIVMCAFILSFGQTKKIYIIHYARANLFTLVGLCQNDTAKRLIWKLPVHKHISVEFSVISFLFLQIQSLMFQLKTTSVMMRFTINHENKREKGTFLAYFPELRKDKNLFKSRKNFMKCW